MAGKLGKLPVLPDNIFECWAKLQYYDAEHLRRLDPDCKRTICQYIVPHFPDRDMVAECARFLGGQQPAQN